MEIDSSPIDELKQLREKLEPLVDKDIVNMLKTNFNDLLKKEKFDLIITHKGKGTNFFKHFINNNNTEINYKSDLYIQDSDIKDKSILLFDDAIKTGGTIEKKINDILNKIPSKLTVASLLITSTGFEKINIKSSEQKFNFKPLGMVIPDKFYDHMYRRLFFPLIGKMDYHLEEYPEFVLEIKSVNNLNFKKICDLIETKLISSNDDKYEVPFLMDHTNINKYSINFDKYPLDLKTPISSEILLSKIRLWIYFNHMSKIIINIKPIVHLHFKDDIEKCSGSYEYCFKKQKINIEPLCLTCITYLYCRELGMFFYNYMGKELTNLEFEWSVKENLPYKK